jgi:hypothetical protein
LSLLVVYGVLCSELASVVHTGRDCREARGRAWFTTILECLAELLHVCCKRQHHIWSGIYL